MTQASRPDYRTAPGTAAAGATEKLADLIINTSFSNIPPEALAVVKKVTMDGVGVTAGGSHEEAVRHLQEYARVMGETPVCSVVGAGFKTSPTSAAFVNGGACHVLDYEVMWNTHPTSPLLPPILALAEWKGFSGKDVLTAMTVGLEVTGRLRRAGSASTRIGLHFPGLVGAVASAAACSHLLGLDAMKTRMALGMGASRVSGLFGNVGSDTKCQHCGHAGRGGLESALLAQLGATSNPNIIEWYEGYADVFYTKDFIMDAVTEGFGNPYSFVEDPPNFKRLPAHSFQQAGMEAAIEIRRKYDIDPSQIEELIIEGPVMQYVNRPAPRTALEGRFSYQYTASVALLDGNVTIASFHSDRFNRPDVQELLKKVRLIENNTPPPGYEGTDIFHECQWKKLTARMKDGREYSAQVDIAPGFDGGRALTHEEHLAKMRDCFTRILSPEKSEWCIGILENLENASPGDIAELMDTLRC